MVMTKTMTTKKKTKNETLVSEQAASRTTRATLRCATSDARAPAPSSHWRSLSTSTQVALTSPTTTTVAAIVDRCRLCVLRRVAIAARSLKTTASRASAQNFTSNSAEKEKKRKMKKSILVVRCRRERVVVPT